MFHREILKDQNKQREIYNVSMLVASVMSDGFAMLWTVDFQAPLVHGISIDQNGRSRNRPHV